MSLWDWILRQCAHLLFIFWDQQGSHSRMKHQKTPSKMVSFYFFFFLIYGIPSYCSVGLIDTECKCPKQKSIFSFPKFHLPPPLFFNLCFALFFCCCFFIIIYLMAGKVSSNGLLQIFMSYMQETGTYVKKVHGAFWKKVLTGLYNAVSWSLSFGNFHAPVLGTSWYKLLLRIPCKCNSREFP